MKDIKRWAVAAMLWAVVQPVSTAMIQPAGMPRGYEAVPLGQIRVTHYTHHETGSRLTSSGYLLHDSDEGRVCAISRDWWRKSIKAGDLVFIEGQPQPCVARDTMALRNRKGLAQKRWVDVYYTDRQTAYDYGIHHATAYLLRPSRR